MTANCADLNLLLAELKIQLQENKNANEILTANLEGYTDMIAETFAERFVRSVKPYLTEQKNQIDNMQVYISSLQEDVRSLKRIGGIKNFLLWLSIICNIGLAVYLMYLLVKGVIL